MNILVVEDEEGLREALIHSLADRGYPAEGAGDGDAGYDLIQTGIYDMVLLDIMLPGTDGLHVLSRIRQEKNQIPVILLTARSALDDKIEGMDCGADDYLTKPFEMDELFARIRMVARRSYQISEDRALHTGALSLDLGTYEISCDGQNRSVKLGTKEFQLLEYMMHNAGQVLSRDQISERIWGFDSEAEYNNVDVYVSFLRKKLRFIGAGAQIKAIRGIGYRLET